MKCKWFVGVAVVLGVGSLVVLNFNSLARSQSMVSAGAYVSLWLGFSAIALSLLACRMDDDAVTRLFGGCAIVLSLAAEWWASQRVLGLHNDYPWFFLAASAVLVGVGGWFCRQRILASVTVAGLAFWFCGAFLLPQTQLPAKTRKDGFEASLYLRGVRHISHWYVDVSSPRGKDVRQVVNLRMAKVFPSIPPAIALGENLANPLAGAVDANGVPVERLEFAAFVPRWTRSWRLRIEAPLWPERSIVCVRVPVDAASRSVGRPPQLAVFGKYGLQVSQPRAGQDRQTGRYLTMRVRYCGGEGDANGSGLRVTDEAGRPVRWSPGGAHCGCPGPFPGLESRIGARGRDWNMEVRVYPGPQNIKALWVDLFDMAIQAGPKLVFDFPSAPAPAPALAVEPRWACLDGPVGP